LKKKENHEFIHKRKNRREEKQNIPSFGKKSIKNTDLAYPLNTEKKKKTTTTTTTDRKRECEKQQRLLT